MTKKKEKTKKPNTSCQVQMFSSRICERGTKSCVVTHKQPKPKNLLPTILPVDQWKGKWRPTTRDNYLVITFERLGKLSNPASSLRYSQIYQTVCQSVLRPLYCELAG